jgi:hypothetical protein
VCLLFARARTQTTSEQKKATADEDFLCSLGECVLLRAAVLYFASLAFGWAKKRKTRLVFKFFHGAK